SLSFSCSVHSPHLPSFPTRRSSDLVAWALHRSAGRLTSVLLRHRDCRPAARGHRPTGIEPVSRTGHGLSTVWLPRQGAPGDHARSEEHTSELQSRFDLVCRLLLEKT